MKLSQLHDDGKISDEEFNKEFQKHFNVMMPPELNPIGQQLNDEILTEEDRKAHRIPKKSPKASRNTAG